MSVEHIIFSLIFILGLSLLARPVSHWLHLPFSSILVLLGFLTSELLVFFGVDTGIRADNFQSLIFYVFIPVLVFESAYNMDKPALKSNLVAILFLAIVAMLLTCGITAVLLFYGIGHATGFPWLAALITGSILAATDPVAVVDKLKEVHAPKRIRVLLEGESLFNDATAIVLFSLFLSMAVAAEPVSSDDFSLLHVTVSFLTIFIGGALTGLTIGLLFGYLRSKVRQPQLAGVMSLLVAYGSYMLAEQLLFSGVMSTLVAALSFALFSRPGARSGREENGQTGKIEADTETKYLWSMLSYVANVSVFIIVGAVITTEMFEQRWLAMLIAIVAILLARTISVYGVLSLFALSDSKKIALPAQGLMVWGGLRGAVTLALALSLPTSLEYWWTIQSIAFGVVVFSLFVQAPTMGPLVKKLLH
jgi:CPA1 family monovalent cation:H+ antiporter